MGRMSRLGEGMAKKPIIPFVVLIMITGVSLGAIALNPPSFEMDSDAFSPDNDIVNASNALDATFTSTTKIMNMVDAGSGGDVFTQTAFLDVLIYEKSLYEMEYTDLNGTIGHYYDLSGFALSSPASIVAKALISGLALGSFDQYIDQYTAAYLLSNISNITNPTYDDMIFIINAIGTDDMIKSMAYAVLNTADGAAMIGMLTKDAAVTEGPVEGTGTVSAKGFMVVVSINVSELKNVLSEQLGLEYDIATETKAAELTTSGLTIISVGTATMISDIGQMAQDDITMLLPIAMIVIVFLLLLIYRDIADTLIGLLGLLIAIVWTFGICAIADIQMSTIAIAVPILIMALGIDYGLHLIFRYREERRLGNDSETATGKTMDSVGEALVLATVTTVIAFLSYLMSSMAALRDFGIMCAIGIVCAFVVMLLLVPPFQVMRDRRAEKKGKDPDELKQYRKSKSEHGDISSTIAGAGGRAAAKNPWAVLGVTVVIIALFGYCATNITYNFNLYDFIPDGTEASDTLNYMNENYSTSTSTSSVLIYGDAWDIDTLRAIDASLKNLNEANISGLSYLEDGTLNGPAHLGTVLSKYTNNISDPPSAEFLEAYNAVFDTQGNLLTTADQDSLDALHAEVTAYNEIHGDGDHIDASVVGSIGEGAVTRIILTMSSEEMNNDATIAMMNAINDACSPLAAAGVGYITTGSSIATAVTMDEMSDSQMQSLLLTIALVLIILTIVMYYTDKSLLLGTMATIPTILSVVMVWGSMTLMGVPLNMMTLTIASLAVGLGVTYGIHISHRYVTELRDNGNTAEDAIKIATRETGKGVFGAAITTIAGFGVMVFSKISLMYQFGVITALAIFFGYLGATFVLPAMLVLWGRRVKPKDAGTSVPEEDAADA